jgi:hypothetical protein
MTGMASVLQTPNTAMVARGTAPPRVDAEIAARDESDARAWLCAAGFPLPRRSTVDLHFVTQWM